MVAYWVARSKVNDLEQYKKYADLAPAIIGKFGGTFLKRGGKSRSSRPEKFQRFIIIEFLPERAVARHGSPEYQVAAAHRKKDGAGELDAIVESVGVHRSEVLVRTASTVAARLPRPCGRSARSTNPVALRVTDQGAPSSPAEGRPPRWPRAGRPPPRWACARTTAAPGRRPASPARGRLWPMKWTEKPPDAASDRYACSKTGSSRRAARVSAARSQCPAAGGVDLGRRAAGDDGWRSSGHSSRHSGPDAGLDHRPRRARHRHQRQQAEQPSIPREPRGRHGQPRAGQHRDGEEIAIDHDRLDDMDGQHDGHARGQHDADHGDEPGLRGAGLGDSRRPAPPLSAPAPPKADQRHRIEPERCPRRASPARRALRGRAGRSSDDRTRAAQLGICGATLAAMNRLDSAAVASTRAATAAAPVARAQTAMARRRKATEQRADIVDADRAGRRQHGDRCQVEVAAPIEVGFGRGDMAGDQGQRADRRHLPEVGPVNGEGFHRLWQRQGEQQQGAAKPACPGVRRDRRKAARIIRPAASRFETRRPAGIEVMPSEASRVAQALKTGGWASRVQPSQTSAGSPLRVSEARGSRTRRARVRAAPHRWRRPGQRSGPRRRCPVGVSSSCRSSSAVVREVERSVGGLIAHAR